MSIFFNSNIKILLPYSHTLMTQEINDPELRKIVCKIITDKTYDETFYTDELFEKYKKHFTFQIAILKNETIPTDFKEKVKNVIIEVLIPEYLKTPNLNARDEIIKNMSSNDFDNIVSLFHNCLISKKAPFDSCVMESMLKHWITNPEYMKLLNFAPFYFCENENAISEAFSYAFKNNEKYSADEIKQIGELIVANPNISEEYKKTVEIMAFVDNTNLIDTPDYLKKDVFEILSSQICEKANRDNRYVLLLSKISNNEFSIAQQKDLILRIASLKDKKAEYPFMTIISEIAEKTTDEDVLSLIIQHLKTHSMDIEVAYQNPHMNQLQREEKIKQLIRLTKEELCKQTDNRSDYHIEEIDRILNNVNPELFSSDIISNIVRLNCEPLTSTLLNNFHLNENDLKYIMKNTSNENHYLVSGIKLDKTLPNFVKEQGINVLNAYVEWDTYFQRPPTTNVREMNIRKSLCTYDFFECGDKYTNKNLDIAKSNVDKLFVVFDRLNQEKSLNSNHNISSEILNKTINECRPFFDESIVNTHLLNIIGIKLSIERPFVNYEFLDTFKKIAPEQIRDTLSSLSENEYNRLIIHLCDSQLVLKKPQDVIDLICEYDNIQKICNGIDDVEIFKQFKQRENIENAEHETPLLN